MNSTATESMLGMRAHRSGGSRARRPLRPACSASRGRQHTQLLQDAAQLHVCQAVEADVPLLNGAEAHGHAACRCIHRHRVLGRGQPAHGLHGDGEGGGARRLAAELRVGGKHVVMLQGGEEKEEAGRQ